MMKIAKYALTGLSTNAKGVKRKQVAFHAHNVSRRYAKANATFCKHTRDTRKSSDLAKYAIFGHMNKENSAKPTNSGPTGTDANANVNIKFLQSLGHLRVAQNATGIVVNNVSDGHRSMDIVTIA